MTLPPPPPPSRLLRPLFPLVRSLAQIPSRPPQHRAIRTTAIFQKSDDMPPPPTPNPPLSYTTCPRLNPYVIPYHPLGSSSSSSTTTDPRELVTHRLAVGAAVLDLASAPHRVLVLRRSALEKALPRRWELPGGAAEAADGNLVASAARELWEETGLRARRVGGLVGSYKWSGFGPGEDAPVVPGDQALALPGGGVGIASGPSDAGVEMTEGEGGDGRSPEAAKGRDAWRKFTYLVEVEGDGGAEVKIDPEEHEAFVWATEEEVRADQAGKFKFEWTSEHQKQDILKAFAMAKK